jgi:hypothetical protein
MHCYSCPVVQLAVYCYTWLVIHIINEATAYTLGKLQRIVQILLFAGLLPRSYYASGMSCDRPSRHRFSCLSSVFKQMPIWFPGYKLLLYCVLFVQPYRLKFIKVKPPFLPKGLTLFSQIIQTTLIQKIKILWPLFQIIAFNHPKVSTFTLLLAEGRAGKAWETSNKTMLLLSLHNKLSRTFSWLFAFIYLSL